MTQDEFNKLIAEYDNLYDEFAKRKSEIVGMIINVREFDGQGMYLEKLPDDNIRCLYISATSDSDSPDGASFEYDLYDVAPDGTIESSDGGRYWGYVSPKAMADELLDDWVKVEGEEFEEMFYEESFNYDVLLKEVTDNE